MNDKEKTKLQTTVLKSKHRKLKNGRHERSLNFRNVKHIRFQ